MYSCPHCNQPGVRGLRKWASSTVNPARCKACGGLSAVPVVNRSGILAGSALLLTAFGFLAAALKSPICFAIGFVAVIAFYVWRWHAAPLIRISTDQRDSARSVATTFSLIALIVGLVGK
ncbi:MAG: hypothetical protein ABW190_16115 [Rhizobacter sp.]